MSERICVECGQRIIGRTDKKFCNDHCRTAWHNKMHADATNYVRNVNNILRKNRKILADLAAGGRKSIETTTLVGLGFDFGYFTRVEKTRRYCYEYAYEARSKKNCVLISGDYRSTSRKRRAEF